MNPDVSRHGHRLEALTRIDHEVDSAPDLDTAFSVIVRRTREVKAADVCTVYFTDNELRRHVIAATDGLSPEPAGKELIGNNVLHDRSGFDDDEEHTRQLYRLRYYQCMTAT